MFLREVGNPNGQTIQLGTFTYDNGLSAGKFYTRSEQLTLPSTIQGLYQVVLTTNASNSLYEQGATGNNTTQSDDTMLVSLAPRPDLQVQSITAPETVSAGGTVSLKFTIINQSTVATSTPNWQDKVYLSLDNRISGDDIQLGSLANSAALGPGESYPSQTDSFVVPKRFRGPVFLIVETDANSQVDEFPQESNNILAEPLNVTPLPPSDLVTSDVVAPNQAFEGNQIEVRYTVSNLGIGKTDSDQWTDTIWLTKDKNQPSPVSAGAPPQPNDILLSSFTHTRVLAVGQSYERIVDVTLPSFVTGEWYITPWTDAYDVVVEDTRDNNINPDDPNELDNNNYKARPITILLKPPPDLVVTSVVPTPQATGAEPFSVTWTVENQGANETRSNRWVDTVYLSDSPTLGTPNAKLWTLGTVEHTGSLGMDQSYTGQLDAVLTPAAAGRYIIVKTNSGGSTWEGSYTNNNELSAPTDVTNRPASDLIVTSVVTPPENFSGERATITWTVQNIGAPMWSGTRYWYDEVWLSPDPTFILERATKVGFFAYSPQQPLGTGNSYTQVQEITLPRGISGNYYIYVSTDYSYDRDPYDKFRGEIPTSGDNNLSRQSFEYRGFEDPSNNLGKASIPVTYREPDLRVSALAVPVTPPSSGQTIPVTWTVANIGNRDTREGFWYDRVYLSRDPSLDNSDSLLGQFARNSGLGISSSYTQTSNVTLPEGIEGNFYILVFTDSNLAGRTGDDPGIKFESVFPFGRVPEFQNEGNNITVAPLSVTLSESPDLQVTSMIAPERTLVGQSFKLTYTVKNTGTGDTPDRQASWSDLIYLSRDKFLDQKSDRYLGFESHNGGLAAGASYTVTKTLTVPNDLTGPFYVFAIADPPRQNPRGQVFESNNEGNNATPSVQPMIVELPPPSDLQVDEINIPGSTESGAPIQINWTVTNRGNYSAAGQWSDSVYLSNDAIWDINDRPLGRVSFSGTVAPGKSYTSRLEAALPPATPGQYRIIVRPDILNQVYEASDEANNRTASNDTLNVTVKELQLGVPLEITLNTGQSRLFQVKAELGQTLQVGLTSTAIDAANELFLRFREVPTGIVYDAAYEGTLGPNQSATVPTTKLGDYYILVRGHSEPSNNTPVTLLASVLPFGITDIETDRGGDSRYVTTNILGAQFSSNAIVKLVRPGIAEYDPVQYQVVNSTKITAIFDLSSAPHGLYDVKVINSDKQEAIVPYRYLVERTIEPDVSLGLGGPRVLAPGDTGTYGVSVQSLTNIDTPYVHFQLGIPELGTNSDVFNLPYVVFSSNLRGSPEDNLQDVPWASLVSDVNTQGEILATGYVFDLPTRDFAGRTFNVQTYQGLQEILRQNSQTLKESGITDGELAFKFHILATATALSRDEFIAQQQAEALRLRDAILADPTASQALVVLAANADAWTTAYLASLESAGLLRPEAESPPVRQDPQVVSLMATLATGVLAGPAGEQIITDGNLVGFFEQVRKWYGHNPALTGQASPPDLDSFDLDLSRRTHSAAFNIYVPYGEARVDLPPSVTVPPPNFSSFFNALGTVGELATMTGPLGFGSEGFVPAGRALPYTIRFENAATASTAVGEVRLVTKLDADLDARRFLLGDLRLGDIQVNIPNNVGSFQGDFDFTRTKGFILRVSAGLDPLSNTATWLLQAIDPETGEVVQNPDVGLLPPNNAQGVGTGFVTYTILPKSGIATGTEIISQARVIYNTAAPLDTAPLTDVVDGRAPTTTLTATLLGGSDYQVNWTAVDDAAGSGVKHVTVYVSEDGGTFEIWKQQTTETSGVYSGRSGHTYEFLALATDNAGNREQPQFGTTVPDDGSSVNLGTLPTLEQTTEPNLGPAPQPSPQPSTNQLFLEAEQAIPNTPPTTRLSEFSSVTRPFAASSFATGIPLSHANIGPMAIAVFEDGSVLASGGSTRGSLFRLSAAGGEVGPPIANLPYPVFDMAFDRNGNLWATTGGGPLLQLNPQTGQILNEYADGITQTLAIQPQTGLIYVSSGNGIEVFDPVAETFSHYSDLRVGNMAFAPDGSLWATSWPDRGDVIRFDEDNQPQLLLHFDTPVDSIAFGRDGTDLAGLLFISNNSGQSASAGSELIMVDLVTLRHVAVATGGSRGDIVETTADGRVLLSQSQQIDVLNPVQTPHVVTINPPPDAAIALPQGSIAVRFDTDMFLGDPTETASVLNPANYLLVGETVGRVPVLSVRYDNSSRTVVLNFDALVPDRYQIQVAQSIESAAAVTLGEAYTSNFVAVSDFSPLVDFQFANPRSDRGSQTVSYDVTISNRADYDLLLPLFLSLEPAQDFTGQPTGANQNQDGVYLLDLSQSLPDGRLSPGESITNRTITVYNPDALRVDLKPGVYALPYPNQAPVFTDNPVTAATAGQPYAYQATANDPDGTALGYLLYSGPDGMSVDPATGLLTWSPIQTSPANADVVLQVYDARGGRATQSFTLSVTGGNRQPVFDAIAAQINGREGQPLQVTVGATDPDNDPLSFWADRLPPGAVFDPDTRVLSWTPGFDAAGTYENVQFVVSDGVQRVTQTTTLLIAPTNQAPTLIRPAERTIREGDAVRIQLQGSDPEASTLTYSSNLLPGGARIDPRTGLFEWTPTFFQAGEFEVPFTVSDGKLASSQTTKFTVLNVNATPVFDNLGTWQVQEGQEVRFRANATDPDNPGFVPQDRLSNGSLTLLEGSEPSVSYTAAGLPEGANFDPETAMFSWTPSFSNAGAYSVSFTATDNGDGTGTQRSATVRVPIRILNTNRSPQIAEISNKTLRRGEVLELPIQATDPDGNPLVLTAKGLPGFDIPDFATFTDNGNGTALLRLTPGFGDRGDYTITLTATDNGDGDGEVAEQSDEYSFVVSVLSPNEPPRLSFIGDKVAVTGQPLQFDVRVSDRDQDGLTFSTVGLPAGATLTPTAVYGTARFQWTPTAADVGEYEMTISVSDSGNGDPAQVLQAQQAFNLVVRTTNQAPVLAPVGDRSVDEGQTLNLRLSSSDADADVLTYSASSLPSGAVLDPQQGLLTWTPTLSQAGTYTGIELVASDGNRSSSQTVSLQVNNTNQAPVLVPLPPQSGRENTPLQFTLAAADGDNDPLVYSPVSVLPTGASFDAQTGRFTWTPGYEQAGDYVLSFVAADPQTATDTRDVALSIANVNRPPTVSVSDHAVALGELLNFTVTGSDPDLGTTLAYTAADLPSGATLNPRTGEFSWMPSPGQVGKYAVTFAVSDSEVTATQTTQLSVVLVPIAPDVTIELTPSFPAIPGQKVVVHALADSLAEITNLTLTIDGQTVTVDEQGRAGFVPNAPGRFELEARATDADNRVGQASTVLKVRDPQDLTAPVVAFSSSLDGTALTSTTGIVGTIDDSNLDSWVLELADFGESEYVTLANGNEPIGDGVLVAP